jgi:hypothetical protein
VPQAPPETSKLPRLGDDAGKLLRFQTWEIQLGWSELKNGKWSSKQLIMGSVMEPAVAVTAPPMDMYQFVPYTETESLPDGIAVNYVLLVVYNLSGNAIGGFEFHGNQAFFTGISPDKLPKLTWDARILFYSVISSRSNWLTDAGAMPTIYSLQNPGASFDLKQRSYV